MKRILLATLLGGLIIFVWGSIHHMFLPISSAEFSGLPNEEAVLEVLAENIPEPGQYFYPWIDMSQQPSDAEMEAWNEKHRNGPVGILLYRPIGGEPMPPTMMVNEFLSNIFTALLLALIAASLAGSWLKRSMLLSLVGLFAAGAISFSTWNWFGYPFIGMVSEALEVFIAALLAGMLIAKLVPAPKMQ
ncbi:MAG: hypothetical protein C0600_07790 [Ignavibacteria bacterium]|nr:MAG: hypothetical protein C0600_07790 [Ignavibacteria bacterium]